MKMPKFWRSPYLYYWSEYNFGGNESIPGDCDDVHKYNWSHRCYFVNHNDNCEDVDGFINYISLLYCSFGQKLFPLGICLFCVWLILLFIALAVSADHFFCPNIEVISKVLKLSQNVAGVTIMALGNGAPDIFSSLAGISAERPELVFGELFGAGVFVTTVVAGSVAVTKPFKVMERPFLRDVTFYLVAGFWAFYIFWKREIQLYDSLGFLGLYLVYIMVVVVGRYVNNQIRSGLYLPQIDESLETEASEEEPATLVGEDPPAPGVPHAGLESLPFSLRLHQLVNSLSLISRIEWAESNVIQRVYLILKAPLVLLFKLTIPLVDPENDVDSWCQLLVLIQCLLAPIFTIFATSVAFDQIGESSLYVYQLVLVFCPLLAIIVAFTSRSVSPPVYSPVLAFVGFVSSVVWIYIIANELVSLLKAFGVVFGLSDAILGLTVLAWGNSIGDLIADTAMAKRGHPRTGFSACFGGPLFNLLLGIGLPFTIQLVTSGYSSIPLDFNVMTLTLSIGLGSSLVFSYLFLPLARFKASRIYGIILLVIYIIFLIICFIVQFSDL